MFSPQRECQRQISVAIIDAPVPRFLVNKPSYRQVEVHSVVVCGKPRAPGLKTRSPEVPKFLLVGAGQLMVVSPGELVLRDGTRAAIVASVPVIGYLPDESWPDIVASPVTKQRTSEHHSEDWRAPTQKAFSLAIKCPLREMQGSNPKVGLSVLKTAGQKRSLQPRNFPNLGTNSELRQPGALPQRGANEGSPQH